MILMGVVFLSSCEEEEPDDATDSIKGGTWELFGELMPGQDIEDLRITFDSNLTATDVSFSLDGNNESFSGGDVSGTATVNGLEVEFEVEFGPNSAGFDGIMDDDLNSGTGLVSHRIKQDLGATFTFLIGADPDGTITKK